MVRREAKGPRGRSAPQCSFCSQPLEDVAVEIVHTLRALLSHQPVETRGVLLEPTLAIRGST